MRIAILGGGPGVVFSDATLDGVDLRFSASVRPDDLLGAGYDLVVAAAGANSRRYTK